MIEFINKKDAPEEGEEFEKSAPVKKSGGGNGKKNLEITPKGLKGKDEVVGSIGTKHGLNMKEHKGVVEFEIEIESVS